MIVACQSIIYSRPTTTVLQRYSKGKHKCSIAELVAYTASKCLYTFYSYSYVAEKLIAAWIM